MSHTSPLQQELKKRQPFDSLEQEAALGLVRTSDRLNLQFARLFRGFGLTPAQYNILRILRGEGQPLPSLEIASRTVTVVPGITGLIDRLEKAGLVVRQRSAEDRRVVYVAITPEGLRLLEQLDVPVLEMHQAAMQHLAPDELRQLITLLEKIRSGCTQPPA